jgi:hypothetical protein
MKAEGKSWGFSRCLCGLLVNTVILTKGGEPC